MLLGYARALARGPGIEVQHDLLRKHGVAERNTYTDALAAKRSDPRRMFGEISKSLRSGDVLVVPCLGIFARNQAEISSGMQGLRMRGIAIWSIDDEIDTRDADPALFFKLGDALRAAGVIWRREQTVEDRKAMRHSRMGRRPKLSPKREEAARAAWLDIERDRTSGQIAREIGLSVSRLYAKFGARPRG